MVRSRLHQGPDVTVFIETGTDAYNAKGEGPLLKLAIPQVGEHRQRRAGERDVTKTVHGKVRGKTIELDEDLGVAEGEDVEVRVRVIPKSRKPGEGFLRTEGALADDDEWDSIMEEIYQARRIERRTQV